MFLIKIGKLFVEKISYDDYDREFSLVLTSDIESAGKYNDNESEIVKRMLDAVDITEYTEYYTEVKDGEE